MGGHASVKTIPPTCNGTETDAELRAKIIQLTLNSNWQPSSNRSIRMLAGLSFTSLINLVNDMDRDVCLEILASQKVSNDKSPAGTSPRSLPAVIVRSPQAPQAPPPAQ